MVYKKYKKKIPARKRRYRKKPTSRRTAIMRFPISPFPKVLKTKMRYSDHSFITAGSASMGTPVTYNLNSVYDPNNAVGGDQPMGRDTLLGGTNTAAPYHHYLVTGAKVIIDLVNNTSETSYLIFKGFDNHISSFPSHILQAKERGWISKTIGGPNSAKGITRFSKYYDISSIFGIKRNELIIDDKYGAENNANPSDLALFQFAAQDVDGSGTATTVQYLLTIIYYVTLSERNELASS